MRLWRELCSNKPYFLMKNIVIFTDDPGWHGKQLQQAFANLGYTSFFASLTNCQLHISPHALPIIIPGLKESLPCAVFVRGIPGGSLAEVTFYLNILHSLKKLNVPVYNQVNAIEHTVDKAATSFLLHQAKLPTPTTWVVKNTNDAIAITKNELQQGHFVICKPLFGSQGKGIRRIEKTSDLLWLTSSQGIFYLQRFINCLGNDFSDIRVFVINQIAISAMRRKGKYWLNNVALGAHCEPIELTDALAKLATKATLALNLEYAGIDIIQDTSGHYTIIEVNSIPAWKGLESTCSINIAQLLADDLINRFIN